MTDEKKDNVRTLSKVARAALSPAQAAMLAELRSYEERVVAGEIGGFLIVYSDNDGAIIGDDLVGDVNAAELHLVCHDMMLSIVEGMRERDD